MAAGGAQPRATPAGYSSRVPASAARRRVSAIANNARQAQASVPGSGTVPPEEPITSSVAGVVDGMKLPELADSGIRPSVQLNERSSAVRSIVARPSAVACGCASSAARACCSSCANMG